MLYTVETLGGQGKPLIFAGSESPNDIEGLSDELAGRMASGLVCQLQPLDSETREKLLRRWIDERCSIPVADSLIESIAPMIAGDGRVISGIVNMLNTLQRMLSRSPEPGIETILWPTASIASACDHLGLDRICSMPNFSTPCRFTSQ